MWHVFVKKQDIDMGLCKFVTITAGIKCGAEITKKKKNC